MIKRASALMGLAIVAVVVSHAIAFTDYAQLKGEPWYYLSIVVLQSIIWAVPAFLFSSGYFAAYALARSSPKDSRAFVARRVSGLAIPYLIWHAAFLAGDALRGVTYSPAEYARMIITGMDYYTTFYFIPLLIQLYLLAPFLVRVAKRRPWRLLLLCGAAQLVSVSARWYLYVLAPANNALYGIPGAYHLATVMEPIYLPFMWATFFSLGIVFHMHIRSIRPYLNNRRIQLLLQSSAGVLWIVGIVVTAWLHDSTNLLWVGVPLTVVGGVWALTIVVLFVTCDRKLWQPLVQVSKLAPLTLGIYLLNVRAMHYFRLLLTTGGLDMTTWPRLIPFVIFYIIGIGVPLLLMYLVARSPVPRAHRYLFG